MTDRGTAKAEERAIELGLLWLVPLVLISLVGGLVLVQFDLAVGAACGGNPWAARAAWSYGAWLGVIVLLAVGMMWAWTKEDP